MGITRQLRLSVSEPGLKELEMGVGGGELLKCDVLNCWSVTWDIFLSAGSESATSICLRSWEGNKSEYRRSQGGTQQLCR